VTAPDATTGPRPRYDDTVLVSAAQDAAASRPVPAGTDSYGAFRARLSVLHQYRDQVLGVHRLVHLCGPEGTCTCGLVFPASEAPEGDLAAAAGHRHLPGLHRVVQTMVTGAPDWRFRAVCQACGYCSEDVDAAGEAREARDEHERRCRWQ
jgi:hypothetical protein